jgi:signal transduction histidine kinase/CheY-like chemotaxis protein/CHASE3 domain sensor protein
MLPRRYRNSVGFIVSILLIVGIGIIAYKSINTFNENVRLVEHSYEVINTIELIDKLTLNAESAERGYLLTGEQSYKDVFSKTSQQIPGYRNKLEKLVADNPKQIQNVEILEGLLDEKMNFLQSKVDERTNTPDYDVRNVKIVVGNELMNRITEVTAAMKAEEIRLLKLREDEAQATRSTAGWLIILGTIINAFLLGIMIYNIQRAFGKQAKAEKDLQANNQELQDLILRDKQRNWILNGGNEINMQMRAANTIFELTHNVITGLCKYMNSPLGAFYIKEDNKKAVKLYASCGFEKNDLSFNFNEGLVGQAAAEGNTMIVSDVPQDYIKIKSAIGETRPKYIVIVPIHYADKVNGVIEIAFLTEPSHTYLELLEFLKKGVGSGINTGKLVKRMNELNDTLQVQSSELQKQQEELKATNEELLSQSEALQVSEEELRVQQEELQQTNAELEEKAQQMREQNEALETARKAIVEKADQLEQTSKYKSEFLANMSHELRTPLNSILILAKLLADNKADNLNDKQIEYAKVIHKSGNDLLNLINDILDLSKIEAGKLDLTIEEISTEEIATDINSLFKEVANSKKIHFSIDIDSNVPSAIKTDKIRLEQVLRNLLSNAFKFTMPNGSIDLEMKMANNENSFLNPSLHDAENIMLFRVKDSGIGIPKEKQKIIFEAFQQADGATTRKFGGTGLGLSISRQLSLMLGGELQLESEENKGSTFTLCLPVEVTAEELKENDRKRSIVHPITENEEEDEIKDDRNDIQPDDQTILIVEDDRITAEMFQRIARQKKYKTIVALQGDLGLYYAKMYKPRAIILDVYLPVMDGFTVLKKLKEDPEVASIPVHMISGMSQLPADKGKGRASFTSKPASAEDTEQLFEEIRKTTSGGIKHILIIEDDTIHQQYLQNLIAEEEPGVQCYIAADASEALKIAEENAVECVILDLQLPDASGIETLKNLRAIEKLKSTPIIVYTARNVTKEEDQLIKQYANTIVLKGARSQKRLLEEITLFLHDVHSKKETPALQVPPAETQNVLKGKKVLLVDDDMRNVFALSSILHDNSLNVIVAGDGREALQKLKENEDIDIVLMDIMMPEMDGYQAMQEIRKDPAKKQLPIIALTAKAMKDDREKCLNAGASDYITKPVDTDQLISLMRVWLYSA